MPWRNCPDINQIHTKDWRKNTFVYPHALVELRKVYIRHRWWAGSRININSAEFHNAKMFALARFQF